MKPARKRATTQLDELLCFTVYSTAHAFNRVYQPLLEKLGLTYPQYLVLVALWAEDDQSVGALGEKLHLASSTLTPLLKRLEQIGHVTRRRAAADERQVRVALSPAGTALRAKARDVPRCILEATGLTPAGLERVAKELTAIRERLLDSATPGD